MRVGIVSAFSDYHRRGEHLRGVLQPQIGPLIAALLPDNVEVEVYNDTWDDLPWQLDFDLLFLSCLHSDFDRARQISHYWRQRGAKTVLGGTLAGTYPDICQPFFDAIVVGDPEGSVPNVYRDFAGGDLQPRYFSKPYDPATTPTPRFDLLARRQVIPLSLEATRGCPFTCEFCVLTGQGTRFQARNVKEVVRDLRHGQEMLSGLVSHVKRRMVVFCDNNIGGHPRHLRRLAAALEPLGIWWGSAITFNVLRDDGIVEELSRSGCRFLFLGLESFNPEALADMNKRQNAVEESREVMDRCRNNGILVVSGLMVSPMVDDCQYIESIPRRLDDCGLHVPSFICFETPFPGTPHFHRLAAQDPPALLPNALLRDFSGYTMTVRPKKAEINDFLGSYVKTLKEVYSARSRALKWLRDTARFVANGFFLPSLVDAIHLSTLTHRPAPTRTYLAGSDTPPPETVPFGDDDFRSDAERRRILNPIKVTDETGRVLPEWRRSQTVYLRKRR